MFALLRWYSDTEWLPANPLSLVLALVFAYYGYAMLKPKIKLASPIVFVLALTMLLYVNFLEELVWLTLNCLKFPAMKSLVGWLGNYGRNVLYVLLTAMVLAHAKIEVRFTRETWFWFLMLSCYLGLWFYHVSSYELIDWSYAMQHGASANTVYNALYLSMIGKPLLFMMYRSLFSRPEARVFVPSFSDG